MSIRSLGLCVVAGVALIACSSSGDSGVGGGSSGSTSGSGGDATTATTSTTGAGGSGGADGSGGAGGAPIVAPEAPVMKMVMKMDGALHVTWTNVTTDCDKVLLFRNENAGEYALAYTLTGSATSKHDTQASTGTTTYCYKAQCKIGEQTSPDSNEKCGSP